MMRRSELSWAEVSWRGDSDKWCCVMQLGGVISAPPQAKSSGTLGVYLGHWRSTWSRTGSRRQQIRIKLAAPVAPALPCECREMKHLGLHLGSSFSCRVPISVDLYQPQVESFMTTCRRFLTSTVELTVFFLQHRHSFPYRTQSSSSSVRSLMNPTQAYLGRFRSFCPKRTQYPDR